MKILIVDDEEIIRKGIRAVIDHSGLSCIIAGECSNGFEAIELVKIHHVDLVISDIKMPEMDGIRLAKTLVQLYPEILLIILSGYSDFTYAQQLFGTRTVSYLLKPIRASEFIATLHKVNDSQNKKSILEENALVYSNVYKSMQSILAANEYVQEVQREVHEINDSYQTRIVLNALDYINRNIMEEISLTDVANMLNFSQNYFSKMFKQFTGITVCGYIERVRIEAAKLMLQQRQEMCIYEISESVGYKDAKYFNQVFRKNTGSTPSQYRKLDKL